MNEETILNSIASQIERWLDAKSALTCGLLGGDLGKIIYLYLYSKRDPIWTDSANRLLDKLLHTYRRNPLIMSYCNGLAGFGIGLQILETEGFISGVSDHLYEFDNVLTSALSVYLKEDNIDFLHGATGLGFYFLSRANRGIGQSPNRLTRLIDYLWENAIWGTDLQGKETVTWIFDRKTAIKKYNLSLSHGMSSIAILLSRIITEKVNVSENTAEKIHQILHGVKNYILNQALDPNVYGSMFPTFPINERIGIRKSRLAWCYGDLGILFALISISKAIDDNYTYTFAIESAKWEANKRRSPIENMVYDACICHGASGIAQAFIALDSIEPKMAFKKAFEYWRAVTLKMCTTINGNLYFRNFDVANKKWRISNSFLEGNSGVGTMICGAYNVLNEILLYKS